MKRLRSENLKEDELRKRLDEEKKKINVLVLLEDQELKTPKRENKSNKKGQRNLQKRLRQK